MWTALIVGPQVWDAVLTGKYRMIGDYYGGRVTKGEDRTCDIHCIVNMDEHAYLQTGPNMKKGIEAHRKVDFVVSSAQFLNTPAKYSDIVLPVTTYWERPGGLASSNREFLLCYSQVTEPLYEAKNDQENLQPDHGEDGHRSQAALRHQREAAVLQPHRRLQGGSARHPRVRSSRSWSPLPTQTSRTGAWKARLRRA